MKIKKIISGLMGAVMAISAVVSTFSVTTSAANANDAFDAFIDLDQDAITEAMGAGWNLGNQLEATNEDAYPDETYWGNPKVQRELIHAVKLAGFQTIRIPVSYFASIGEGPDYTIDPAWLRRIKEVVDYAVEEGLYTIINMHGDGYPTISAAWLLCGADEEKQVEIKAKYAACWKQIATVFKDYDEHLIFEAMNEEYSKTGEAEYVMGNISAYDQIFVDTVRQTGGNNDKRWLLVCGSNTNIDSACICLDNGNLKLPTDNYKNSSITENRIMFSVHYYDPWEFCGDGTEKSGPSQWGKDSIVVANSPNAWGQEDHMDEQLKKMYDYFVTKGYPVILGEFGCIDKSKYDPLSTHFRAYYDKTFCETAKKYKCVPVYWDNGVATNSYGLIDRNTYEIVHQDIIDSMVDVFITQRDKLGLAIIGGEDVSQDWIMPDSWAKFLPVLENARTVYNNESLTDDDYIKAASTLKDAINNLEYNPDVTVEKVITTTPQTPSAENKETDNYIMSITSPQFDFDHAKQIKVQFTVDGEIPNDETAIAFRLAPYGTDSYDGWNDNYIYFSDCTKDENGVYTGYIDAQAIITTYKGSKERADGINIYYGSKNPSITLTGYSLIVSMKNAHVHSYQLKKYEGTCIERARYEFTCISCGEKYTEYFMYGNHSYVNDVCELCGKGKPTDFTALQAAITKADAIDPSWCTDETIPALTDALAKAKSVLAKGEEATQYEADQATDALNAAIEALEYKPADYAKVDAAVAKVPSDLSKYTDESAKAVRDAVAAVDRNKNKSEQSVVDGYATAIENAIAKLVVKPATSKKPAASVTTTKATRSAGAVKKDKSAAKKAMKQAKITKLTVKSNAKKKINATWNKVKKAKGYEVQVSTNKKFKKSKIIFKKLTTKKKLTIKNKKIKSKKTYYVRVRAYATYKDKNNVVQKVYSAWNKKLSKVKVK